jgi:hypothetical protein
MELFLSVWGHAFPEREVMTEYLPIKLC